MTDRIRLVIQAFQGPSEPDEPFAALPDAEDADDAENAANGDSERSAGIVAPATSDRALAPRAFGAYPPCEPGKHTSACLSTPGPCIYSPAAGAAPTSVSYSTEPCCTWCRKRAEHYYLTMRNRDGTTERYCTKYCYDRNGALVQRERKEAAKPSAATAQRWPVAQIQYCCSQCWEPEDKCSCIKFPPPGVGV